MLNLISTFIECRRHIRKKNLFAEPKQKKLIIHCCHHKAGTAWFTNVLTAIAQRYGCEFQSCPQEEFKKETEIFMQYRSKVNLNLLPSHRGSHLIRDLRDIVISGYFYHLWSQEKRLHIPREEYGGHTYQQYLQSLDQAQGITVEMERLYKDEYRDVMAWNYQNVNFIEVKYEELIADEDKVFKKIFAHYGFSQQAIKDCLDITHKFSFNQIAKRPLGHLQEKNHLRTGLPGQWRKVFTDHHRYQFKEMMGEALIKLGYEKDFNW